MTAREDRQHMSSYGRLGVMLVVIGALVAIDGVLRLHFIHRLWPLLITILGGGFIGLHLRRSRREGVYMAVGTYLILVSVLMLYCNFTGWLTLAWLWPMFILFLGVAFVASYLFGSRAPLMLLGGLLLASVAVVFLYLFTFHAGTWWIALILAGVSFFLFDRARMST